MSSLDCRALKDLHARLDERGLFEPSRFWTRKLLLWLPLFFLSYLGLLLLPFGVLIIHFGVVRREERYLEARFGDDYRRLKESVPRYGWPL